MRRSAELLHAQIPNSKYQILNGYSHGELSLNHPNEYVELLINTLSTSNEGLRHTHTFAADNQITSQNREI